MPYALSETYKGVLHTNGTISCTLLNVNTTNFYYIVIKHQNAIETWSANPVLFSSTTNYDFTTSASQAFGSNQREVESGVWAIYSGELNADDNIDLLDIGIVEGDIDQFLSGYYATDINGDGNVDLLDAPTVENNVNGFVFASHP